ncbi:MAG: hypothetical protein MZW92_69845 [Comamonadaceae bacterium]|nr:hypothetical protein [Comamonadaceae bacterium]
MMIVGFVVTAGAGRAACSTRTRPTRLVMVVAPWSSACARAASTLSALAGVEGRARRRAPRQRRAAEPAVPRGAWRRSGHEPAGAPLHDLRLRLDARLQRAGPDPRAVRRHRVRLHAGRVDAAVGRAARRRAGRHAAGRRWPAARRRRRLRLAARSGRSAAASPRRWRCSALVLGRRRRRRLAAARQRVRCSAWPTARSRSPRSAR